MLKITFLGTGTSQGIPIIGSDHPVCLSDNPKDKRLRVSVLIQWEQHSVVIDCGPDFRQQLLNNPIPRLDALLFTHEHADHTAGLDDIRPFCFQQGALPIYVDKDVQAALEKRFGYIFETENRYPGAPSVTAHRISKEQPFTIAGKTITPVEVMHHTLAVLGFRIDNFAYLTDVKAIAEEEREKLQDLDVLVVSALRIDPHPMHLNLDEALQLVAELQPKRAYFTHISHLLGFHDEVSQNLPENVFLAYDNLKIESS